MAQNRCQRKKSQIVMGNIMCGQNLTAWKKTPFNSVCQFFITHHSDTSTVCGTKKYSDYLINVQLNLPEVDTFGTVKRNISVNLRESTVLVGDVSEHCEVNILTYKIIGLWSPNCMKLLRQYTVLQSK